MLNFRCLFILLFIFSCDDEAVFNNPLDENNNPDYIPPETFLLEEIDGIVLDTSSVNITIQGNELISHIQYQYFDENLNQTIDWTDWIKVDSSNKIDVQLDYLDEGNHSFLYRGRYLNSIVEEVFHTALFSVDAVQGPGLRVYPEYQYSEYTSTSQIYLEEVSDVSFGEIIVEFSLDNNNYTTNLLEAISPDFSALNSEFSVYIIDLLDESDPWNVKYKISFGLSNPNVLSGSISIGDFLFSTSYQSDGDLNINIIQGQLIDYQNNAIPIVDSRGGSIAF